MRPNLRTMVLAGVLALVSGLGIGTSSARAHDNGYGGRGGFPGGGFGGGVVPGYRYYGNGGHDYQPHWHRTQTPFGSFSWYGNGAHDFRPHEHSVSPYGYRGYSGGPFHRTESFYPSTPYRYMPW